MKQAIEDVAPKPAADDSARAEIVPATPVVAAPAVVPEGKPLTLCYGIPHDSLLHSQRFDTCRPRMIPGLSYSKSFAHSRC